MRESIPEGFDFQHAMSPPMSSKQRQRGKRDSAHANVMASPLFNDLHEGESLFDSEAQSHLTKNRQALANR